MPRQLKPRPSPAPSESSGERFETTSTAEVAEDRRRDERAVEVRERDATTGDLLRELIPEFVILLGAVYLFFLAGDFTSRQQPGQLGPGFWPRLAAIGLAVALLVRIVQAIREHRRPIVHVVGEFDEFAEEKVPVHPRSVVVAIGLAIGYVAATMFLGYMFATMLFLGAFAWLGGQRRWLAPVVGMAGGLVLTYVFVGVVYVSVPTGVAFFDTLTVAIYRLLGIQ
jgi:putative tricarboxylic transport membrane protein